MSLFNFTSGQSSMDKPAGSSADKTTMPSTSSTSGFSFSTFLNPTSSSQTPSNIPSTSTTPSTMPSFSFSFPSSQTSTQPSSTTSAPIPPLFPLNSSLPPSAPASLPTSTASTTPFNIPVSTNPAVDISANSQKIPPITLETFSKAANSKQYDYLLSEEDRIILNEFKESLNYFQNDKTALKRKVVSENIVPLLKEKLSLLFKPVESISSSLSLDKIISAILGEHSNLAFSKLNEYFDERYLLLEILSLFIVYGDKYASLIREESMDADSLNIVNMESKDSNNSWMAIFVLMLFDLFFEEEEENEAQGKHSLFSQILARFSSIEDSIPILSSGLENAELKKFLHKEKSLLAEVIFHCASKLIPLNMSEWESLLRGVSKSVSPTKSNSIYNGLLAFSIFNGILFHSPFKPMYDLVRSRLPHRQDYFSSKENWSSWVGKMDHWLCDYPWPDSMTKYMLSLGWGLFLKMSKEVRLMKGNLSPCINDSSLAKAEPSIDQESAVSDKWAIEGILAGKGLLIPKSQSSLFSIISESLLSIEWLNNPSIPFSPWGIIREVSQEPFATQYESSWVKLIYESVTRLASSILIWGSIEWIKGSSVTHCDFSVMASFCDMISNCFWISSYPVQTLHERRKPFLTLDSAVFLFWESDKFSFFTRTLLSSIGISQLELMTSALKMFIGLAHGPVSALFAFDLLDCNISQQGRRAISWTNLFSALEQYQFALLAESGEISPAEVLAIESILMLLITICRYLPSKITQLFKLQELKDFTSSSSPTSSVLSILFGILSSKVSVSLKAHILLLLNEWMKDQDESLKFAPLVWAYLEASQIIPTISLDSFRFDEELSTPISNDLGGIMHEFYQVEAPLGTYPVTTSLLYLIRSLLLLKDRENLKMILGSLGLESRKTPGFWPYVKFIFGGILVPLCTGTTANISFISVEEKMDILGIMFSILDLVLRLKILPNFHDVVSSCTAVSSVLFNTGSTGGEVLGLPSLQEWRIADITAPIILTSIVQNETLAAINIFKFLLTLLDTSKNPSKYSTLEEIILINSPHFLSILSQIISLSTCLDLVILSIELLKCLLSVSKIESIFLSVLGMVNGVEKFSLGISRWFGPIYISESTDFPNELSLTISIIQQGLIDLLILLVLSPNVTVTHVNVAARLLGFNEFAEHDTSSILLKRLVENLHDGNFNSARLLCLSLEKWKNAIEIIRNTGADPLKLTAILESLLDDIFTNGRFDPSLFLIGDALHFIALMIPDKLAAFTLDKNALSKVHRIFSTLLSIQPSQTLVRLADQTQQISNFVKGHAHAISGIALLLSTISDKDYSDDHILNLIVDSLNERGSSWCVSILDSLTELLSRTGLSGNSFYKLLSLVENSSQCAWSNHSICHIFTALTLSLKKTKGSRAISEKTFSSLDSIIVSSVSMEYFCHVCKFIATLLSHCTQDYPENHKIATCIITSISQPSKLEEFIRSSFHHTEISVSNGIYDSTYLEFISALLTWYSSEKDESSLLACIPAILASGFFTMAYRVFTNEVASYLFIPMLEISLSLVENSPPVGAVTFSRLRNIIGHLISIPLSSIRPNDPMSSDQIYIYMISVRIATLILKRAYRTISVDDIAIFRANHHHCVGIFSWLATLNFSAGPSKEPYGEILSLLCVLIDYFIVAHEAATFNQNAFNEVLADNSSLFIPSLSIGENANEGHSLPTLGVLLRFIDVFCSTVKLSSFFLVGLEQCLMLLWLTLGAMNNNRTLIPVTFFTDMKEVLSLKLHSLISVNDSSSLQYCSVLAKEIKQYYF